MMSPKKKISIIIIEDNRLLRDGISSIINEQQDLKVVAAFSESEKTLSNIVKHNPDIVLIDLGLRNQNSLKVVKSITKKAPEIKIIVMDLLPVESDILNFIKAGASGFVLKDNGIPEFLKTIRSVASGEKVLPHHLAGSLFSQIIEKAVSKTENSDLMRVTRMTKRERQVIELIADGLTNKEIGNILSLSPYTVKSHVHNILEKMALNTRVQIAVYANTGNDFKDTPD